MRQERGGKGAGKNSRKEETRETKEKGEQGALRKVKGDGLEKF